MGGCKKNLPDATTYVEIEGGNHGQFGAYGMQKGDHEPAITDAEQLDEVSEAMGHWLQSMDESL